MTTLSKLQFSQFWLLILILSIRSQAVEVSVEKAILNMASHPPVAEFDLRIVDDKPEKPAKIECRVDDKELPAKFTALPIGEENTAVYLLIDNGSSRKGGRHDEINAAIEMAGDTARNIIYNKCPVGIATAGVRFVHWGWWDGKNSTEKSMNVVLQQVTKNEAPAPVWRSVYESLELLGKHSAKNKYLVLLTAGSVSESSDARHRPEGVIKLSRDLGIPIYVVGISATDRMEALDPMKNVCKATLGEFIDAPNLKVTAYAGSKIISAERSRGKAVVELTGLEKGRHTLSFSFDFPNHTSAKLTREIEIKEVAPEATPSVPASVPGTPPAPPAPVLTTNPDGQIKLTWKLVEGAESYKVKRSFKSGADYVLLGTAKLAQYTDTTAVKDTSYFYVVSAVNDKGEGVLSAEVASLPPATMEGKGEIGSAIVEPFWRKNLNQPWFAATAIGAGTVVILLVLWAILRRKSPPGFPPPPGFPGEGGGFPGSDGNHWGTSNHSSVNQPTTVDTDVQEEDCPTQMTLGSLVQLDENGDPVQRFPITKNNLSIGRHKDNDIRIIHDSVSAHHATTHRRRDGEFEVTDLNSSNGVYIANKRVSHSVLRDGDIIDIGEIRLRVELKR